LASVGDEGFVPHPGSTKAAGSAWEKIPVIRTGTLLFQDSSVIVR
jgi:hypothetical protein